MYNTTGEKNSLRDRIVKEKSWFVPSIHEPSGYEEGKREKEGHKIPL